MNNEVTPTTRDMEEAREIADAWRSDWQDDAPRTGPPMSDLKNRIAQALAARTEQAVKDATAAACAVAAHRSAVPEGHVRLSDGRVCKVLGTLPMTADGCVIGMAAKVWEKYAKVIKPLRSAMVFGAGGFAPLDSLYSTEEAALAAKEKA